jgi:hypothetical protein
LAARLQFAKWIPLVYPAKMAGLFSGLNDNQRMQFIHQVVLHPLRALPHWVPLALPGGASGAEARIAVLGNTPKKDGGRPPVANGRPCLPVL